MNANKKDDQSKPSEPISTGGGMISRNIGGGSRTETTSAPNKFVRNIGTGSTAEKKEGENQPRTMGGRSIGGGDGWHTVKK